MDFDPQVIKFILWFVFEIIAPMWGIDLNIPFPPLE